MGRPPTHNATFLRLQAENVLRQALESPIGIEIKTSESAMKFKAILYRFRKELGDPELMNIQIRLSPLDPNHSLWLIRKSR